MNNIQHGKHCIHVPGKISPGPSISKNDIDEGRHDQRSLDSSNGVGKSLKVRNQKNQTRCMKFNST